MKIRIWKSLSFLAIGGVGLLVLGALCFLIGFRVNTTESIPLGIYMVTDKPITKGAYVILCPPDTELFATAKERGYLDYGLCPGNYGYLMKRVLGVPGDVISISEQGVTVGVKPLPLSRPIVADGFGRPLPQLNMNKHTLTSDQLLLMSDTVSTSFDARYFGPINEGQIKNVIRPLWLW